MSEDGYQKAEGGERKADYIGLPSGLQDCQPCAKPLIAMAAGVSGNFGTVFAGAELP